MSHDRPGSLRRKKRKRSPGVEGDWGSSQRLSPRKLARQKFDRKVRGIALVLLSCLAVAVGVFVVRDASRDRSSADTASQSPRQAPLEYVPPPESPEAKSEAAMRVLEEFLETPDPARRLPLLFDPEAETQSVLEYYAGRGRTDPQGIRDRKATAILDKDREIIIVTFNDGKNRTWAAPFEWNINAYRLHWGSMTGYGEIPWDRFLAERPAKPVRMRVKLYIPDSDSPALIPETHTYALISHPELEKPLGALISPAPSLKELLKLPKNSDIPANVAMQWQDFDGSGSWPVVTELIHRNWITP